MMRPARDAMQASLGSTHAPANAAASRVATVDVTRGIAIIGVVVFHLVWDLAFLGFIPTRWAFHPAWLLFGRLLAGTFVLLVGVSLVLSARRGWRWRPFVRRLAVLVMAAAAITFVTRFAFADTYVYFGILHVIAVGSVVGAMALRSSSVVLVAAAVVVLVLGNTITSTSFDPRWLAWTGFAADPPPSNDFVPVFPWVGLTLLGIVLARAATGRRWLGASVPDHGRVSAVLAWCGRHSLAIYLVHQPLLLGVLVPVAHLFRRSST